MIFQFQKKKDKKMKKVLLMSVITAGLLTITGCSSKDANSVDTEKVTEIKTVEQAKGALGMSQAANFSAPTPAQQSAMRTILKTASSLKAPVSKTCADGGSYAYDMDDQGDGSFTYNDCKMSGMTINGTRTYDNGKESGTITWIDDKGETSSMTFRADNTMQYQSLTMTFTGDDFKMTLDNFEEGRTLGVEMAEEICRYDTNSSTEICEKVVTGPFDSTLAGKVGVQTTDKAFSCMNGNYKFTTITPMHHLTNDGSVESGTLKINDVTYEYHSEGTITVTLKDGTSSTIKADAEFSCQ